MKHRHSRTISVKFLSSVLALVMMWQGVAAAAPAGTAAPSHPLPTAASVGRIELPSSVALVDDRFSGNSGKSVILIQDAHTNESGQMNIARALERILPSQEIRLLFTEGADAGTDVTPDMLKTGSPALREKVGQSYLRKGMINGSEYLSMTSAIDFRLLGTEDPALYREAGELYRQAADSRGDALRWIDRLSRSMNALKTDLWSEVLRQLDAERELYRAGQLALTDYFDRLSRAGLQNGIDPHTYPNLKDLMTLRERENRIDWKMAAEEESKAIKTLPEEARTQLAGLRAAYSPFKRTSAQNRDQGPDGFFAALEAALLEQDKNAAGTFAALFEYFSYVRDSRAFSAPDALKELADFERAVWAMMTTDAEARELELFAEAAARMRRIAELQASPDDFEAFNADPRAHDPAFAAAWVNRRIADLDQHYDRVVTIDADFEPAFAAATRFYQVNGLRDDAIVHAVESGMNASGEVRTVLVTGGFHTPNLKRLLEARGISYVSVLPQVTHETDMVRYERLVREAVEGLDRAHEPAHHQPIPQDFVSLTSATAGQWMMPAVASPSRLPFVEQIVRDLRIEEIDPKILVPSPPPAPPAPSVAARLAVAVTRPPVRLNETRSAVAVIEETDPLLLQEADTLGELGKGRASQPNASFIASRQTLPDEIVGIRPLDLVSSTNPILPEDVQAGRLPADLQPYFASTASSPAEWMGTLAGLPQGTLAEFFYADGGSRLGRLTRVESAASITAESSARLLQMTLSYEEIPGGSFGEGTDRSGKGAQPGRVPPITDAGATATSNLPGSVRFGSEGSDLESGLSAPLTNIKEVAAVPGAGPQPFVQNPPDMALVPETAPADYSNVAAPAGARLSLAEQGFTVPIVSPRESFEHLYTTFRMKPLSAVAKPLNPRAASYAQEGRPITFDASQGRLGELAVFGTALAALGATRYVALQKNLKTAADSAAVNMVDRAYLSYTEANPNIAIVVYADEGDKDGSISLPLRTVYFGGAKRTYLSNDNLFTRIDELQAQGVEVWVSQGDAIDNTNGLVNPEAAREPGDSVSIIGFVPLKKLAPGESRQTPFLTPDAHLRVLGPTLNLSGADPEAVERIKSALTPFSLPSRIIEVLQRELGESFDPNRVSFVVLGAGKKQAKHQHIIDDALALIDGTGVTGVRYPGLKLEIIPDGDPTPRFIAGIGGELQKERTVIVLGRGGSTENVIVLHALRTVEGAVYVHTYVSPTGTEGPNGTAPQNSNLKAWSPNAADGTGGEAEALAELAVPAGIVEAERLTEDQYEPGVAGIASITGLTNRFGDANSQVFSRVRFARILGIDRGTVSVRVLFTLLDGAAFLADLTFELNEFERTRELLLTSGAYAANHFKSLEEPTTRYFDRLITQARSELGKGWEERIREVRTDYLNDGFHTRAADRLQLLIDEAKAGELIKGSVLHSDWKILIGLLRGIPEPSGARLSESDATVTSSLDGSVAVTSTRSTAGVGTGVETGSDTSVVGMSALEVREDGMIARPRLSTSPGQNGVLEGFVAGAVLNSAEVSEGSTVTLADSGSTYWSIQVTSVSGDRAGYRLHNDPNDREDRGVLLTRRNGARLSSSPVAVSVAKELELQEDERLAAVESRAGLGMEEIYHRIPVGSLFPEFILSDKGKLARNLTDDEIRGHIVTMLHRLSGVYGNGENKRYVIPYLDLENLSVENQLWIQRLVKQPGYNRFNIISPDNRIPDGLVINWYVDKAHKQYRHDIAAPDAADFAQSRHATRGPNLLVPAVRKRLEPTYEAWLNTSFNFIKSVLPDVSVVQSREAASEFDSAVGFKSGDIWENRGRIFRKSGVFAGVGDLFLRVQGQFGFEADQVAAYRWFDKVSDWIQLQKEMARRASIAV
jgi:hypothetical protein